MDNQLKNQLRKLLFGVRMSTRYHTARHSFFMKWNRFVKIITVLNSTAVAVNVIAAGPSWLFLVAGFTIALVQAVDLVIGFGDLSNKHLNLSESFIALESKIISVLNNPQTSQGDYTHLMSERNAIERKEGSTLFWLAVASRNAQIAQHQGQASNDLVRINWLQRNFIHYTDKLQSMPNGAKT